MRFFGGYESSCKPRYEIFAKQVSETRYQLLQRGIDSDEMRVGAKDIQRTYSLVAVVMGFDCIAISQVSTNNSRR